jgi:hypothetical protein
MTEPLTELPRTSANGTAATPTEAIRPVERGHSPGTDYEPMVDSPPGTPRWVKALAVVLVVLFLALAGLHLTGNAPTHMPGSGGAQHGMQAP